MIRVYWLDSRAVNPEAVWHLMSPARRIKIEALRLEEDRRRSAAAELALVLAMAAERNHAPQPVLWQARENGKPYLADGPHFSLSHSGDIVLCAVYDAEVGVDVEMPRKIVPGLRRKILSDREKACETEGLLTAWVAKESYLKYTGEGLRRAMTEFSVQSGAVIDGEGVYQASVQRVALPVEGAIACVCTGQKDELCIRQLFWKGEE